MKKNTARKLNATVWIVIAVVLMVSAYCAWSKNGEYTVAGFLASLVFYGGFSLVIAMIVDELIYKRM